MIDDKAPVDLLLTNCRIAPSPDKSVERGAIALRGADIADIGSIDEMETRYRPAKSIDCGGGIAHAGLIEPHLHLLSLPFSGMGLDALGTSGLTYSDVKSAIDPEATNAFARYAAMHLLQMGYTTVCEPGTAFDLTALADGLHVGGISALISAPYCWDDIDMFARVAPGLISDAMLRRAPSDTDRCLKELVEVFAVASAYGEAVQGFACLYGLGSASDTLILEAKCLARAENALFNMHQDYNLALRQGEIAQYGVSGTERLDSLGVLDAQTSLTHMVYGSEEDFASVARARTGIIWCPINILHRGYSRDSTCLHVVSLREGSDICIAADTGLTFPVDTTGNAARLLAASQGTPIAETEIFAMQTTHAARCLGIANRVGQLRPGARADIVVRAADDLLDTATELAGVTASLPIEAVIAAGRVVVRERRYIAADGEDIIRAARTHRARVLARANA